MYTLLLLLCSLPTIINNRARSHQPVFSSFGPAEGYEGVSADRWGWHRFWAVRYCGSVAVSLAFDWRHYCCTNPAAAVELQQYMMQACHGKHS